MNNNKSYYSIYLIHTNLKLSSRTAAEHTPCQFQLQGIEHQTLPIIAQQQKTTKGCQFYNCCRVWYVGCLSAISPSRHILCTPATRPFECFLGAKFPTMLRKLFFLFASGSLHSPTFTPILNSKLQCARLLLYGNDFGVELRGGFLF